MTITVGINFKPKNLVEVLHYHKIQVQLNISRICTPKIREREFSRKQLVLDNKKGYATTLWIYELGLFKEVGHEISSAYQFPMTFKKSFYEFLLESGRHEISHNQPQWTLM